MTALQGTLRATLKRMSGEMVEAQTPPERQVELDATQRTLIWRHNHGYVKCKTCHFCNDRCHVDDVGIWSYGTFFDSRHTWYCSVHCANGLSYAYLRQLLAKPASRRSKLVVP